MDETGTANTNDSTILLNTSIERSRSDVLEGDSAAMETECLKFLTTRPSAPNQFTNQNDEKIDAGYDSKGELLYIPEGLCKDDKDEICYDKQPILATTTNKPIQSSPIATQTISIDDVKKLT